MRGWSKQSPFLVFVLVCAPHPLRAEGPVEDPGLQELAATYYATKHALDYETALRRVAIQDRAAGIEDEIATLVGDEFAGVWYDAHNEGRLEIGLTERAEPWAGRIRDLARARGVDTDCDLVPVRFTEAELVKSQEHVRASVMDLVERGHVRTSYDTSVNSVIVTALATLPPDEEDRVRRLEDTPGVLVRRTDAPSQIGQTMSCNITYCDAPLRGGRQIGSSGGGGCTAAFMARWNANPQVLLALTAGHCDALFSGTWSARDEGNQWHQLGSAFSTLFAGGTGLDAGTIRINTGSFWFSPTPAPWVVVKNGPNTTYNPNYAIKSDSYSSLGQVLCRTGAVSGTHCAEVSKLGSDLVTYDPNGNPHTLLNMGELDMCAAQPGDSGGPIYKSQRAYGIFSSSISAQPIACAEVYQGVRGAEKALDVSIMLAP
jgi:hypothetical protein